MSPLRHLRLLLPLLAVLGLLVGSGAPLPAQAVAAPAAAEMQADMPCCPPEQPPPHHCAKSCPLQAACMTKCFQGTLATGIIEARLNVVAMLLPGDDAAPPTRGATPPPRPPRT